MTKPSITVLKHLFTVTLIGLFLITQGAFLLKSVFHVESFSSLLESKEISNIILINLAKIGDVTFAHPLVFDWFALVGLLTAMGYIFYALLKVVRFILHFFKSFLIVLAFLLTAPAMYFLMVKSHFITEDQIQHPIFQFIIKCYKSIIFYIPVALKKAIVASFS
ncbi:hypothetical protein GEMRC1_003676 [Eukaryota sp. GEM-RC1]